MMKFNMKGIVLSVAACFSIQLSHAQLFSIDVNGTVRSDVTAPGFTPWYVATQAGPGKSSATQSFTNFVYSFDPDTGLPISSNPFTLVVTDNGTPNLSATQSFNVMVNPLILPGIVSPQVSNGQIALTVSGSVGPDYAVQVSSNLLNWDTLLITNPTVMPFSWSTNAGSLPAGYYRIKVGPPLP
jgi:hypothetical protein